MLKRIFSLMLGLISFSSLLYAQSFEAGKDFVILKTKTAEKPSQAVSVVEFFSYGCPWCYKLEDELSHWAQVKSRTIEFQQIPVIFHKDWELYAKAYYTAEALSLKPKLSPLLFKSIIEEKKTLNNPQAMIDFFTQQGVSKEVARSAFLNSPAIEMAVNNGMRMMAVYQINAVPALVVDRHYKTDLQMAQSKERLFAILDYLVAKAEKERQ